MHYSMSFRASSLYSVSSFSRFPVFLKYKESRTIIRNVFLSRIFRIQNITITKNNIYNMRQCFQLQSIPCMSWTRSTRHPSCILIWKITFFLSSLIGFHKPFFVFFQEWTLCIFLNSCTFAKSARFLLLRAKTILAHSSQQTYQVNIDCRQLY